MLPTGIDNGMRYLAFYVSILDQAMGEFYMVQRYLSRGGSHEEIGCKDDDL